MEKTAYLRKVTKEDAALLYEWANDDECRKNSFYPSHIEWEEQVEWLDKQLSNPSAFMLVFVNEGHDIGQIRLDRKENCYVISYSIAKPYRLMGYGKQILMLAENYLYELPGDALLYAQVKKDNIASQLLFEGLGYDKRESENYIEYEKSVERYENDMFYKKLGGGTLLLTNNKNAVVLYKWLCKCESNVRIFSERLCEEAVRTLNPEIVISYNYKYIIEQNVIEAADNRIINMHISFLPYNRGAQPNFWSFIDDTPKGVTIHRLERGLDKGDIICQRQVMFDESIETFASTYVKLNDEIVKLFQENWEQIKNGEIEAVRQNGRGSYHDVNEFRAYTTKYPIDWNDVIADYKKRCREH